jgi:transmembrane sensor
MDGDVLFDVVHNELHPFSVTVGDVTLTDIGTVFSVHSDFRGMSVAVREGSVRVDALRDGKTILLKAGDRADRTATLNVERGGASKDDFSWTEGALVFRDAPLERVTADLRRWYGVELRVNDSTLDRRHVTATFSNEPAQQALKVIALALGATLEQRGDTAFLRSSKATGRAPK